MRTMRSARVRLAALGFAATLMCTPILTRVALATAPIGACCLTGGTCADLLDSTCESQGGTFIGIGTACSEIDCSTSLAAPALSIAGLIAAIGTLVGLGLYRLFLRPHRRITG